MITVSIPNVGESITEAVLSKWHKADGDAVAADEPLCELETDKATLDLPSPSAGTLRRLKQAGDTVQVGDAVAEIDEAAAKPSEAGASEAAATEGTSEARPPEPKEEVGTPAPPVEPSAQVAPAVEEPPERPEEPQEPQAEKGTRPVATAPSPPPEKPTAEQATADQPPAGGDGARDGQAVRRVPMSNIRRRIAERLVRAQRSAAMLTTFNEIDMTAVLELRARHKERFAEVHGVSLGITSFFVRATALALKQYPILNAHIDGNDVVYHEHVHLGLAVSTERGLVVAVLREAESLAMGKIEQEIKRLAAAARDGKLAVQDLSGGTFTITNGGIFGSLLSTPILNPPETGILGMHAIQKRPVVVGERIEARDMVYVALTYDHRLVDGKDAVLFLVRIKELLEDPTRMLFEA